MAAAEVLLMAVVVVVDLMVVAVDQEMMPQILGEAMAVAADHIIMERHRLIKNLFQYLVLVLPIMGL